MSSRLEGLIGVGCELTGVDYLKGHAIQDKEGAHQLLQLASLEEHRNKHNYGAILWVLFMTVNLRVLCACCSHLFFHRHSDKADFFPLGRSVRSSTI